MLIGNHGYKLLIGNHGNKLLIGNHGNPLIRTNCAAKLARLCNYLGKLAKLLDIATLMNQHSG